MNLWALPDPLPAEELETSLYEAPGLRITRIVSAGQCSPPGFWYDQSEDEWLTLLAGRATLEYADGSIRALTAGDTLLIPRRVRHRVRSTSAEPPCVWLCVYRAPEP